ncbi:MAG: SDR family NAD(P)-dependent oxidoreductase, partial [Parcubacteria group bacterium]|nr:SDR family NAD(P)-dependent oxidoreductase [Parcubacteria group bacterium]
MEGDRINYNFSDQVVLITGAGRGIGEAVSKAFAKTGAKLVLVDINEEAIKELKNELVSTLQEED